MAKKDPKTKKAPDGTKVPSVTTVLGIIDKSGPLINWAVKVTCNYILERLPDGNVESTIELARKEATRIKTDAGDLGHEIHKAVEEWAKRKIDGLDTFMAFEEPRMEKAWDAFLKFAEDHELEPVLSETSVVNYEHGYGGTLDLVATMKPTPESTEKFVYLLDIKSSNYYLEVPYGPQVAAYEACLPTSTKRRLGVVRLDKETGEPHFHDLSEKKDLYLAIFHDSLRLWKSIHALKGPKDEKETKE
jgi:hypothetical protein